MSNKSTALTLLSPLSRVAAAVRPSQIARTLPWSGATDGLFRELALRSLRSVRAARIVVQDPSGTTEFGPRDQTPLATIRVHDMSAYRDLVLAGSVGAGESFARGAWDCDELPALLRQFAIEGDPAEALDRGPFRLRAPLLRALSHFRHNDRAGARDNIAAHYDLGNDLFERVLDPTMMYSCAYFEREDQSLEEASLAKLRKICETLDLGPNDHLLEIGSGWGGMAMFAAREFGCRVTTTTISAEQARLVRDRIAAAGLADRIELLERDYRDLQGSFDKIVSIEMIEAIGAEQYGLFFQSASRLLRPYGAMLVQTITIGDQRFERARKEVDFIKHCIFPGSCIPSVTALSQAMTESSDLRLVQLDDITLHYGETLRRWRERLRQSFCELRQLGRSEHFLRLWDFYFAYCEAAFDARYIGDVQLLYAKPGWRPSGVFGRAGSPQP